MSKEEIMQLATKDLEILLNIIGDLGYTGYKISMCKLRGYSHLRCARKYKISKMTARRLFAKCQENQYDVTLKRMFQIK